MTTALATALKETNVMLSKVRIVLAATILALAAVSAVDSGWALGYENHIFHSPFWDFGP
jgi:hypothetical protein